MTDSQNDNGISETPEGITPAGGSVSRRRIVIAGAMLAPVFLTMRVRTARAQSIFSTPTDIGTSETASCDPNRSKDPTKCDLVPKIEDPKLP